MFEAQSAAVLRLRQVEQIAFQRLREVQIAVFPGRSLALSALLVEAEMQNYVKKLEEFY